MTGKKILKFSIITLLIALIFSIAYFAGKMDSEKSESNDVSSSSSILKMSKMMLSGEKTFLVLFQNNMELRPGGGFIGSFGVVKIENGKVKSYEIHDTSNFDGRIPENKEMPFPMKKVFRIDAWKLRDSNYSPDYPTNAKKALEFYYQGQGGEKFDGVLAMNAAVLESILKVTGPIKVEGYPVVFEPGSALITLEKQVEIDFAKQGIERENRKDVMHDFLNEVLKKTTALSKLDKLKLAKSLVGEFKNKNIQLYFNENKDGEALLEELGWSGKVDSAWDNDYLMVVDANLGAYKSDYFVKRNMQYTVDLAKEIPEASLKITYNHTGKVKDWMTRDYLTYLRVYLPKGARINNFANIVESEVAYGEEFNKKFAGGFVKVPLNSTKTIEIKYSLPRELRDKDYKLKIQKQSGSGIVPTVVDVKLKNGETKHFDLSLNGDVIVK